MATALKSTDVPAPPAQPPAVSLLTASPPVDGEGERWEAGFSYAPEGCGSAQVFRICNVGTKAVSGAPVPLEFTPFGLVAADRCSTFGYLSRDYEARATRKLLACESKMIASELWGPNVEGDNVELASASSATVVGGPVAMSKALSYIEQALADCGCGGRSMIHVRPYVLEQLLVVNGTDALRRDGGRWLTGMDNVLVADAGYKGTGPGAQAVGATEWIYATAWVRVHHGPVRIIPGSLAEATDRATNTVTFYAERVAAVDWDRTCCQLALEVTR